MNESVVNLSHLHKKSCMHCSLQSLCLPSGIDAEGMHKLDDIVKNRRPLQRGELLYRAGERMTNLYVVREGAFKTSTCNEEGVAQVIGFQIPGELMGLDAIGEAVYGADAQALTNAKVCEIPLKQLEKIASELPVLQHQLLRIAGQNIHRDHEHIEILGRRSADEKMAMFLHCLSERYHQLGRPNDHLVLPMSREDIGSYLGVVIETVSRTLSKMQEEGLISVQGRQIQLKDVPALAVLVHEPVKKAH